jgi:putative RecB family exonuclease
MAFRFSSIERLPEPPSPHAVKGTLVHRALELLLGRPPEERLPATAHAYIEQAAVELREHEDPAERELAQLELSADDEAAFVADAHTLMDTYLALEDPKSVAPLGLELRLEAQVGGLLMLGVIDRLEEDEAGQLVVTDYKTGRAPTIHYEQHRLGGVHFYAFLCERLFGKRPAKVQLLYLAEPVAIITVPTDQSIRALERRVRAIWTTVERACENESFQPRPSRLCDWCSFQSFCPAFGGDPAQVPRAPAAERPLALPLASTG